MVGRKPRSKRGRQPRLTSAQASSLQYKWGTMIKKYKKVSSRYKGARPDKLDEQRCEKTKKKIIGEVATMPKGEHAGT